MSVVVPHDLSRIDQAAVGLSEAWALMASWMPGGRVDSLDGGVLVTTAAPAEDLRGPLMFDRTATHSTISDATVLAHQLGRTLAVDVLVGHVPEVHQSLADRQFQRVVDRQVMVAAVSAVSTEARSTMVRVADETDLAGLRRLQIAAFDMTPEAAEVMMSAEALAASPHVVEVVDGEVVAMAIGIATTHTIGVFGVATAPHFRRRGAAARCVRGAVTAARELTDAGFVWLQANDDVAAVYGSLGFETITRSEVWLDAHV